MKSRMTIFAQARTNYILSYANNILPRSLLQSQLPDPMKFAPLPGIYVFSGLSMRILLLKVQGNIRSMVMSSNLQMK